MGDEEKRECMDTSRAPLWPPGILSRVSREAYDAVGRSRGFAFMTPGEREDAARSYDALTGGRARP